MAATIDDHIGQPPAQLAELDHLAPDLLGADRGGARLHLPVIRHRQLRHLEQSLQRHAQLHLRRGDRARHDHRHHHRRHRSLGRLGALPLQHGAGGNDACRLLDRGRHRRLARHGARHRRGQRRPHRLCRHAALRGDARHAVDRPQPRHGRLQQHRRVPVRPRSRQAAGRSAAAPSSSASPTPCST